MAKPKQTSEPKNMSDDDIKEIIAQCNTLEGDYSAVQTMYTEIEKMYFMDVAGDVPTNADVPPADYMEALRKDATDPTDVKLTISPSVRNAVIGLVRLLTTSEPMFKAKAKQEAKLSEIEKLCKTIWRESCKVKVAELHTDAVRSAAIYSDVHLTADRVDDLLKVAGEEEQVSLEAIKKRTPILISVSNPKEGFPSFGPYGMRGFLRIQEFTGAEIEERWKSADNLQLKSDSTYTVKDWIGLVKRLCWVKGHEDKPLIARPHGLKELNVAVQLADGSDLWRKPEQRRQPFLYAMWKGGWWRRQNSVYTSIFTSIGERGSGVLIGAEEDPQDVKVNFAGPGVRWLSGMVKPKVLSDTAFDPQLIPLLERIIGPVTDASTIFPQTLGDPEGANQAPYSSLAMLSQSGLLPAVPVKKTVGAAMVNLFMVILRRIKDEAIDLGGIVDMVPSDIPDDLSLEVTLEIKLPQDMFRNIQMAETALGLGLVDMEWIQENIIQVHDSKDMRRRVWRQKTGEEFYKLMVSNALAQAAAKLRATGGGGGAGGAEETATTQANTTQRAKPRTGVTRPGGSAAAQAGGGTIEAVEPQAPAGSSPPEGQGSYE